MTIPSYEDMLAANKVLREKLEQQREVNVSLNDSLDRMNRLHCDSLVIEGDLREKVASLLNRYQRVFQAFIDGDNPVGKHDNPYEKILNLLCSNKIMAEFLEEKGYAVKSGTVRAKEGQVGSERSGDGGGDKPLSHTAGTVPPQDGPGEVPGGSNG